MHQFELISEASYCDGGVHSAVSASLSAVFKFHAEKRREAERGRERERKRGEEEKRGQRRNNHPNSGG